MEVRVKVPDGRVGSWAVETYTISESDARMYNINCHGRPVDAGTYKKLVRFTDGWQGKVTIMSNTPMEISDFSWFVRMASGKVLVAGLGLGVVLQALVDNSEVEHITVIEKEKDVVDLVAPTFKDNEKVTIVHADIFTWSPDGQKFDFGWFDIWDNICGDNWEEMKTLKRRFARKVSTKHCWCEEETRRAR